MKNEVDDCSYTTFDYTAGLPLSNSGERENGAGHRAGSVID